MPQKKRDASKSQAATNHSGGIHIERSDVQVGGDMVARDKITLHGDNREIEKLFQQLVTAIQNSKDLNSDQKQEALAKSRELESELNKPEPDLSNLTRLKQFLQDQGGLIATAVGAVFQYPPVQETIKTLAQRLIGG